LDVNITKNTLKNLKNFTVSHSIHYQLILYL
jgi:calcium-dependent protein kinase